MAVDRTAPEYFADQYQRYGKAWYENNKETQRETQKRYRERYPEKVLWRSARLRASKRGIDFSIAVEDIHIPDRCPVFGVPFLTGGMQSASLDRIDNRKGYIPGNIQVISRRANTMKGNATESEMKLFAEWVLK